MRFWPHLGHEHQSQVSNEIHSLVLFRFESTTGLGHSYEYSISLPIPLNPKPSSQSFNRRPLMRFTESTYPNPPIGQLTEPRDINWQFWEIVKASSLIFMIGPLPLQILALCWFLIRFIATIIRVRVSELGLRQSRVRAKFRHRVLIRLLASLIMRTPRPCTHRIIGIHLFHSDSCGGYVIATSYVGYS